MKTNSVNTFTQGVIITCGFALAILPGCASLPENQAAPTSAEMAPVSDEKWSAETRAEKLRADGSQLYLRGDYPRAIAHFEIASLMEPQAPEIWPRYLTCYSYLSTGQLNEALHTAENIVREEPYSPLAYQQLGLIRLWMGEPESALTEFQKSLEFDSHLTSTHFYMGLAYHRLGKKNERDKAFTEAEKEYSQVLQKNPRDLSANYELSMLYLFADRNIPQAGALIAAAREGLGIQPHEEPSPEKRLYQSYYFPVLEGIYEYRSQRYEAAVEKLLSSLSHVPSGSKPDVAEIYHYLARAYLALGKTEQASPYLEKGIDLDPNGIYANDMRESSRALANRPEPKIE